MRSGGIATYPFPRGDGHAPGVENLSAAGDDSCCIADAAVNEALTQPAQEALTCLDGSDSAVSGSSTSTYANEP